MAPCERRVHRHRTLERLRQESKVESCEVVPVAPFRDRFCHLRDSNQITLSQLCIFMGWTYLPSEQAARRERRRVGVRVADRATARRTLGLSASRSGNRACSAQQEFVTYDVAERLCRALAMDPYEAGI